jgi:hypothetical protein
MKRYWFPALAGLVFGVIFSYVDIRYCLPLYTDQVLDTDHWYGVTPYDLLALASLPGVFLSTFFLPRTAPIDIFDNRGSISFLNGLCWMLIIVFLYFLEFCIRHLWNRPKEADPSTSSG